MISIIIPFYNNEDKLKTCLSTVQNQTYTDFECILVNNNSTDNSFEVCKPFLEDKRFKLIECKDQGVHHARNKGLEKVKGDWIMFIDADDHITNDYLQYMINIKDSHPGYKAYTSSSIVLNFLHGNYVDRWHNIPEGEYTKDSLEMYDRHSIWSTVWACLWSKDVFKDIRFKTPIGEDTLVCIEYLVRYNKVYHTKYYGYAHIINQHSISQQRVNYMGVTDQIIKCLRDIPNINSLSKEAKEKLNDYYFPWTNIKPFEDEKEINS